MEGTLVPKGGQQANSWQTLFEGVVKGKEMEATLVPKGGQRAEGEEEARIMMRVHGQEWNCWRNTLRSVLQN